MIYTVLHELTGEFISIKHGETGYYETTVYDQDHADELNRRNGVTAEQCEQAITCSMTGNWDYMGAETGVVTVRPTKRGQRIWLEGGKLSRAGFKRGLRYTRTTERGIIVMSIDDCYGGGFTATARAGLKGAGKGDRPIIDISAKQIGDYQTGEKLTVTYGNNVITIARAS